MNLVPCIFCDEEIESKSNKVIAKVCNKCLQGATLTTLLKNLNSKKIEEVLNKKIILTKDGELI